MKVEIEYCASWNYLPKATSLVDEIKNHMQIKEELVASGGGVFEVKVDGDLIYSKKQTGQFPDEGKIVEMLKKRAW